MPECTQRQPTGTQQSLQCGNGQTNMPKQAFRICWITFLNFTGFSPKLVQCNPIGVMKKTYCSQNLISEYLWKSTFEICPKRVWSASSTSYGFRKLPKWCLDVHLRSADHLKAPRTMLSQVEKIFSCWEFAPFTTQKNQNSWITPVLPCFLPDKIPEGLKCQGGGHTEWLLLFFPHCR